VQIRIRYPGDVQFKIISVSLSESINACILL
jgi:hypothetical protein